jgi:hypothetical protein
MNKLTVKLFKCGERVAGYSDDGVTVAWSGTIKFIARPTPEGVWRYGVEGRTPTKPYKSISTMFFDESRLVSIA